MTVWLSFDALRYVSLDGTEHEHTESAANKSDSLLSIVKAKSVVLGPNTWAILYCMEYEGIPEGMTFLLVSLGRLHDDAEVGQLCVPWVHKDVEQRWTKQNDVERLQN